jgi:hypothetical protein
LGLNFGQFYNEAIEKQHIIKTSAATLNKSKKRKNLFFFLDLLSAVAKALGMYCFSDRYRQGVGSYFLFLDLLRAVPTGSNSALFPLLSPTFVYPPPPHRLKQNR